MRGPTYGWEGGKEDGPEDEGDEGVWVCSDGSGGGRRGGGGGDEMRWLGPVRWDGWE